MNEREDDEVDHDHNETRIKVNEIELNERETTRRAMTTMRLESRER